MCLWLWSCNIAQDNWNRCTYFYWSPVKGVFISLNHVTSPLSQGVSLIVICWHCLSIAVMWQHLVLSCILYQWFAADGPPVCCPMLLDLLCSGPPNLLDNLVSLYLSDLEEMGESSYGLSTCHFSCSGHHTICVFVIQFPDLKWWHERCSAVVFVIE